MNVKKSKKTEIQIEKMKDIISIEYDDVVIPQSNGKNKIFPGYFVVFGDGKLLYLTSLDSEFEEFARRLREVYLEEKDNIVSDGIMGPQTIRISPETKQILLNGELEKVSSLYEKYQNEEGYEDSLLFEEDELNSIFPIFDYHLRSVLKRFDIVLGDIHVSNGNNGSYYLTTTLHNMPVILPIAFHKEDDSYSLDVGNILPNSIPIHMDIQFNKESISVRDSISEYDYSDHTTYALDKDIPYCEREVYWNGECIFFHKEHLPMMEGIPDDILPKEEGTKWYVTPWNGYIGTYQKEKRISDEDYVGDYYFYYVHRNIDTYYEREYDSKKYFKYQPNGHYFFPVIFDSMNRKIIGVRNGNVRVLESSFYDPYRTGFYKDHLIQKHFYSISQASSWKDADNGIFIHQEDGVLDKADLLDHKLLEKRLNKNGNIQ